MKSYPTTCLTHGSILKSPTHVKHLVQYLEENEDVATLPLTDIGTLSQCVYYYKALKKLGRKPILGTQIPICPTFSEVKEDNENTDHNVVLYAKNLDGWHELLRIMSYCNDPLKMTGSIRISMEELEQFDLQNLIVFAPNIYGEMLDKNKDFVYYVEDFDTEVPRLKYSPNSYLWKDHSNRLRALLIKGKDDNPALRCKKGLLDLENYGDSTLYDNIEEFDITHKEELPQFCEDDIQELKRGCWEGLKRLGLDKDQVYLDRIKKELDVLQPKGFSGYFLIMADIIRHIEEDLGGFTGVSRGSFGGCLIGYLIGSSKIDPIKYNLIFERFYNPDRNDMPDQDLDLPPSKREDLLKYIASKYGSDRLGQLSTYGTIKGAGALKLCLGQAGLSFFAQNAITDLLPQEAKVAPELKDQNNEFGTKSLVLYSLRSYPEKFEEYVKIDKKTNKLSGKYANEFQLAIDLDETIVSEGKHASAFALFIRAISSVAPIRYDAASKRYVVGVEMNSSSDLGLVKLDLLGLDLLDKAKKLQEGLKNASFVLTPEPWRELQA